MITKKVLRKLKPQQKPYFIRSNNLRGLSIKVNSSGTIKYVVETKHLGRSHRKTIGTYPIMSLREAEHETIKALRNLRSDYTESKALGILFKEYINTVTLKPNTLKNYREVILFYLHDWLQIFVSEITKRMVEERFSQIRDKGINGGMLNHKSNDITGQYIQWNSKANLEVMKEALERVKY